MQIVARWWTWFGLEQIAKGLTFEMFLVVLTGAALLFLLAATALPDEVAEGPIDLRAHWAAVSRRWWILYVIHWLVIDGIGIWAQVRIEHAHLLMFASPYLLMPLAVTLIFIRNRWWQTICLSGLAVLDLSQFFGHALTS